MKVRKNWTVDESGSPSLSRPEDEFFFSLVTGSPATTCNMALHDLSPFPIDLVLSGPNFGRNSGRSFILSSGTVGGAMEGSFAGKKSISISFAFNTYKFTREQIDDACNVAVKVVFDLWEKWNEAESLSLSPSSSSSSSSSPSSSSPSSLSHSTNDVELYNINIPLGSGKNPKIYSTHALTDHYGRLFHLDGTTEAASELDVEPSKFATEAETVQTLSLFSHLSSGEQHLGDFKCDFGLSQYECLPDYKGSDVWAIKHNHVSVTGFRCKLQEAEHERVKEIYPRYEEDVKNKE